MDKSEILLGVNIDHVATLRQARLTRYPSPVQAALVAEHAGADGITLHLREDRRHIQDDDIVVLIDILQTRMNLEMAITDAMIATARKIRPQDCCLVPESREELTTEGGLDVAGQIARVTDVCAALADAGIAVSLFIDAEKRQIDAAKQAGAPVIEIHTGQYADAKNQESRQDQLAKITKAVKYASDIGLQVNAGHGLDYHCVEAIARIPQIHELNIGHAIIARAVFRGLDGAVRDMKRLMREARQSINLIIDANGC